jgi:hypothetical protein
MLGMQRRLEARIGQLLPAQQGKELPSDAMEAVSRENDRSDFRLLARCFKDCELGAEEQQAFLAWWRAHVTPGHGGDRKSKDQGGKSATSIPAADATKATGIDKRWRR